jgi:protoporphyrinogen oxidase
VNSSVSSGGNCRHQIFPAITIMSNEPVVIIGAGPAGLTAAYELARRGIRTVVFERSDTVGGIARTERYRDYYFDIGGHRFFTKIERINQLWQEMMGNEFIKVPRMSRIYYNGKFFHYPLNFTNTLLNLGILESLLILVSYLRARIRPHPEEETFDQWVSNRFGERLFRTFFKTYTEKVWGIPCSTIRADWAAQRIKGLSLLSAVSNAIFGTQKTKSLISEFDYPLFGPGMMWQRFQEKIEASGGVVHLNSQVVGIGRGPTGIKSLTVRKDGLTQELPVGHLISSIPLNRLALLLDPEAPPPVREAADGLSYRAFLIVVLIVGREHLFPDQWIYIHSPEVRVGRIQNFKNWSAAMVPDSAKTSIGMEYFCNEGDDFWEKPDDELVAIASRELELLGLAESRNVTEGLVVRQPNAYPVYDQEYKKHLATMRDFIGEFENLQTIGRSGMHRYNNMDHSMLTGLLAAENLTGACHNLWEINEEEEYLEEGKKEDLSVQLREELLVRAFARMDKIAMALAVGTVSGLVFFLATLWLVIKGGDVVGPHLRLLAQYFTGYTVTVQGSFIVFCYTFFWGFLFGWLFAYLRNFMLGFYLYRIRKKAEIMTLRGFFDYM